jgi:hypothetical protein
MPVAIGQKLESDFRNPLGLLSDCHRRIERFLGGLIVISEQAQGNRLDEGLCTKSLRLIFATGFTQSQNREP